MDRNSVGDVILKHVVFINVNKENMLMLLFAYMYR